MVLAGNRVTSAVIRQLKQAFPQLSCYREEQDQGQRRPAFYVYQVLAAQEKRAGNRYHRVYRVKIHYLPNRDDTNLRETLDDMGNQLLAVFRTLTFPDGTGVWGREQQFEIADHILHFTVEFTVFALWNEEHDPAMKSLESNVTTKDIERS